MVWIFFLFCKKQGYVRLDLAEAVPTIRTYKLATLPRCVSEHEVQKILDHIDRSTPIGLRDFALIQILRTYGVRGGQACALRLQDILWKQNRIRFPALKRGKEIIEPLTHDVGDSLLQYLRRGRPQEPDLFGRGVRQRDADLRRGLPFGHQPVCQL